MRIGEQNGEEVSITFEGKKLTAYAGEPIAIGLLANGIRRLSISMGGRKRGAFYVGPAPVEVNGRKRVDSRKEPISEGMNIRRGRYDDYNKEPETYRTSIERRYYEVIIVGGGPAGIGAAQEISGVVPTALIEKEELGGRAKIREDEFFESISLNRLGDVYERTTALGVFYKGEYVLVPAVQGRKLIEFYAKRVILATGSVAGTMVFENNDMPGIFRVDSALKAITLYKVAPGERIILTGRTPELIDGILRKYGLDYLYVPRVKRVEGEEGVERVYDFEGNVYEADAVIVSDGKYPDINPSTQAGASVRYSDGFLYPETDEKCRINEFVYIAGSARRPFKEHRSSYYHGRMVGSFVLEDLGYEADGRKYEEYVGEYYRYDLGNIPIEKLNHDESFVCGCDVTLKKVLEPIRLGYHELQIIKRLSHVAMGFCQGRYCLMHVVRLLHQLTGKDPNEMDIPSGRPPLWNVKMGILG